MSIFEYFWYEKYEIAEVIMQALGWMWVIRLLFEFDTGSYVFLLTSLGAIVATIWSRYCRYKKMQDVLNK
jgi:hypothetical protein